MSGPREFEDRLRRLIGTEHAACPSWAATTVIFVSGMIVGCVLQTHTARVPSDARDNLATRNNRWPTR